MELQHINITVVDDNNTLDENIPYVGAPVTEGEIYDGKVWGDDGIDPRKASTHHLFGPKLPSVSPSIVTNLNLLDYFLILFTMGYVNGTMPPGMKRRLPEGYPHVSDHEFIKWLGMWLVMECYEGKWGRRD